jgi:hypothetical protein
MKGLMGTFIKQGIQNDDDISVLRPIVQMDKKKIVELTQQALQTFLRKWGNSLSVYALEGAYGLANTLFASLETKGLDSLAAEAIEDGDAVGYMEAIVRSLEQFYFDLYSRGALDRLKLVDEFPEIVLREFEALERVVNGNKQALSPEAQSQAAEPEVKISITDQALADYRGNKDLGLKPLSSDQFKKKWLNNQKNRPIWNEIVRRGWA